MNPRSLYKYMPLRYVGDFVQRGRVLFRNLTYFRCYDTDPSRGDLYEGRQVDRPEKGAQITNRTTGVTQAGDFALISSIPTEGVFAFCMSTRLDLGLYEAFNADACVEITSPSQFVKDCRQALRKLVSPRGLHLFHGEVEYYRETERVQGNFRDPTVIPFFKPARFAAQREYRIVLANPASLQIKKRMVYGHALPGNEAPLGETPKDLWLRLRGSRQYMKTHRRGDHPPTKHG